MGLGKKTIDDQNYCGKKVLVRCDFNVPMKDGVITNENRINAALPTIQKLVNDGAKAVSYTHLEHRALARRPWAKKADRIKVETLLISKRLFYAVYGLGEWKNKHTVEK